MNNFLEASRLQLRFNTSVGVLSVEQLWGLSLNKLGNCIKAVKTQLKGTDEDSELNFLDENKTVDKTLQLTFDILKEIYLIKKEETDNKKNEAQNKLHNEKILSLIKQKEEAKLTELTVEELEKLLIK